MAPAKRWMTVATDGPGGWRIEAPQPVGDPATLLQRLHDPAQAVAFGIDVPIGLPRAYVRRHRPEAGFPAFLRSVTPPFYTVCAGLDEVSGARPFYPATPRLGMTRRAHAEALGLADAAGLSRQCDRATPLRPAGAPLFWTLGANQAGKAGIAAWRDMLQPALAAGFPLSLWPFDGPLRPLLRPGRVVIAETYPAEAMRQLGLRMNGSKRRPTDRAALAPALLAAIATIGATATDALTTTIVAGFGPGDSGEDSFDSVLGVLCVIGVCLGRQPDTAPADPWIQAWEGWVLGQAAV